MLTSSHVNKTLVLRIYLLSLPRKSEKSVKIGNRKPYEEPLIWGGHPGRDIRREQVGGIHLPPLCEPSRECLSPIRGPWALGVHGDGSRPAYLLWALAHGSHGTQRDGGLVARNSSSLGGREYSLGEARRG